MNTWLSQAEEAVRKQAEERRRAAEAEAEAERAKAAESRAKADAELEEQRQREMQALQTDAMDLAGPQVHRCFLRNWYCGPWFQAALAVNLPDWVQYPCSMLHVVTVTQQPCYVLLTLISLLVLQDTGRFEGGGGNALAALGLVSKPEDDDDDSDSESDDNDGGQDQDMEDAEKEEGEA